jgi:hypothetical protein
MSYPRRGQRCRSELKIPGRQSSTTSPTQGTARDSSSACRLEAGTISSSSHSYGHDGLPTLARVEIFGQLPAKASDRQPQTERKPAAPCATKRAAWAFFRLGACRIASPLSSPWRPAKLGKRADKDMQCANTKLESTSPFAINVEMILIHPEVSRVSMLSHFLPLFFCRCITSKR